MKSWKSASDSAYIRPKNGDLWKTQVPVTVWGGQSFQYIAAKIASDSAYEGEAGVRKDLHPNLDFFVADIWSWALKDDQASMEHPIFSLSKSPDFEIRRYEHNGSSVTVAPSVYGHPTIWDKDILIYCCSQLIAGMKEGQEPQQVIRLTARDFLVSTNRAINNLGYDRLKA